MKKLVNSQNTFFNKFKGHDTFLRKVANSGKTVANYVSKVANDNKLSMAMDIIRPGTSSQLREGASFGQRIADSAKKNINGLRNNLEIMQKKPEEKSHFV